MKLKELQANPFNPRKIEDKDLDDLKESISKFGSLDGVVYNEVTGRLVTFHQRQKVLEDGDVSITRTFEQPTSDGTIAIGYISVGDQHFPFRQVRRDEPTEQAAMLLSNNHAGEWDFLKLPEVILNLDQNNIPLKLTGFDMDEIANILRLNDKPEEGLCDPDEVPEQVEPKTKLGDIYQLGNHRLMCGDSTDANDVMRLMSDSMADMMWTDPPYNVALGMDETPEQAKARNRRTDGLVVKNDKMSDQDFREFLVKVFSIAKDVVSAGGAFYIAHADSEGYNFRGALRDSGWLLKQCLIWVKSALVMGRQDYHWRHEPILYGWKEGAAHNWLGDRKQSTVLEFEKPSRNDMHPTMKPVELIEYCLGNNSANGSSVFDPFGGSGSTLIACEKTKRKCFMMEIDPYYCDVIVARWENFTGKKAELINQI